MATPPPDRRQDTLGRVLRSLLRPLAKVMIAHGITASAMYRMLKEVLVEVAVRDFPIEGRPPTDSRVSMLTGVHRKDVRAIRADGTPDGAAERRKVSALASVVGRWLADPETCDADGAPRDLPRRAEEGPSFEALARSVSTDIRPRTVLDELMRQGLVAEDPATGLLRLDAGAFVGPADAAQRVHFFSQNVGDHIAAATENLLAEPDAPPFLERAVFYNRLTPDSVDALEAEAREMGADLLVRLNRSAFERQRADMARADATERFRFGVFFYRAPEGDEAGGDPSRTGGEDDAD